MVATMHLVALIIRRGMRHPRKCTGRAAWKQSYLEPHDISQVGALPARFTQHPVRETADAQ